MNRTAAVTAALCLSLAGCGGGEDPTLAASGSATPTPAASTPAASAAPRECPVKATEVEAPAGSTTDLSKKPVVKGSQEPAPEAVQVADIVEGDGAEATTLSNVEVKYVGAIYETGKEFDSSWKTSDAQTLPFTVCSTGVIPGFAIAPTGMKVGDHWERKAEKGPSDAQAARSTDDGSADGRRATAGGVDANASKKHLYELAQRLEVQGRSTMSKDELVEAIGKENDRRTRRARS